MDCEVGNGPRAIRQQRAVARLIAQRWQGTLVETPNGAASVDVLFARDGELVSIGEIKIRSLAWRELVALGGYLITYDKLQRGQTLAQLLGVPFDLFVSFRDDVIGWWRIAHATGDWASRFVVRETETAATCNGGRARRSNAYLDLRDATLLRGHHV
jgi:hypothetical protein